MQDREKAGEGALSSKELEQDRAEGGTTLREEDAPGHTLPESERDPTETGSDRRSGIMSGTILPPD